ncbi:MAG: pyruvate, phosphate dikinase, partial [Myxococcota bacterium]
MSERTIYAFSDDLGGKDPRELLGGKGAGLAEMTRLGIPVPPGFTIATPASRLYHAAGAIPDGLWEECIAALGNLERAMDRRLGDPQKPLLVSVRSGAAVSMPGMMDTVLNLGLNEETVMGLAAQSGDERFALDAYRRFIEMFADVVLGVGREAFDRAFREQKQAANATDQTLPPAELRMVIGRFFDIVREAGQEFPLDAKAQLREAIGAVFRSWNNPRAIRYRRMQGISDDFGTAVNIQAMVFGNLGEDSGSGVAFTRNPSTGDKSLYGEFLTNAQGEDVVAGIRNPRPLTARGAAPGKEAESMERVMPEAFADIQRIGAQLEGHFRDLQDIEFTIERNKVYILQTRSGKRTGKAALKIAVDMVDEGVVNQQDAVLMVDPTSLEQLLHAQLPAPEVLEERGVRPVAAGLPASPGAAVGRIVLDADEAVDRANAGEVVVLVRRETSPEDIHGMRAAAGVITATGGMTSHAAVVARGLGKCCVAGCRPCARPASRREAP